MKYIIPDILSHLASSNTAPFTGPYHSELHALYAYSTTLVGIHLALVN